MLLCLWWHRKSGYRPLVGYLYPVLAMLLALATLVSPLSKFLLWLEPLLSKGSFGEWIMLGIWFAVPAAILVFVWRGRMKARLSWRNDWPLPVILVGAPLVHLFFTLAGGHFEVLWLVAASTVVLGGMVIGLFVVSARAPLPSRRRAPSRRIGTRP
jgi:hypothetical protein